MARILLVEDNATNREMLSRRLTRRGHEVSEAVDGADALRVARDASPDLILMDMSLPIMSGWDATTALKADEATAGIPVIALTAHAMVGDREKALEAGCDEFETKPIAFPQLIDKINSLLGVAPNGSAAG